MNGRSPSLVRACMGCGNKSRRLGTTCGSCSGAHVSVGCRFGGGFLGADSAQHASGLILLTKDFSAFRIAVAKATEGAVLRSYRVAFARVGKFLHSGIERRWPRVPRHHRARLQLSAHHLGARLSACRRPLGMARSSTDRSVASPIGWYALPVVRAEENLSDLALSSDMNVRP